MNNANGSTCGNPTDFVTIGNVMNNVEPNIDNVLLKEKTFIRKNKNINAVRKIHIKFIRIKI